LRYRKEDVIIYVNTLLPFGAALAGKFMGKKVIYHLHESYIQPRALKMFLRYVASSTAETVLYVSNYLSEVEHLKNVKSQVVYNALPDEFVEQSLGFSYHHIQQDKFCVLMVCSLKTYKGVHEFISLSQRHQALRFELVLNANELEIQHFFVNEEIPKNLFIYPVQKNLHPFYQRASLVVNLTNPSRCIETFGLTLLEAMCYGVPVIAPPVGGPSEFVKTGWNGFTIDVRKMKELDETIENLASDKVTCSNLSNGARLTSQKFTSSNLQSQVNSVISLL
jgi:glycosyltransferase involved in cell wall biosynthesis